MKNEKENKHSKIYRRKRRLVIILSAVLLIAVYLFKDSSFFLRAISTISFLVIFYVIDHFFDIRFKAIHYFCIIVIATSALLFSYLYYIYPNYDKIQHFLLPMLVYAVILHTLKK